MSFGHRTARGRLQRTTAPGARARRACLTLALGTALGCAAAPPRPAPPHPVARQPAPPPPEPWATALVPDSDPAWVAAREADDALDVVYGALRATFADGHIEWARQAAFQEILASAHDGNRWWFATADGALLRAESFRGDLTRVGEVASAGLPIGYSSGGSLLARAGDGRLWVSPMDDAIHRAPIESAVADAGFANRLFGVAVAAPGTLYRTLDGGQTYQPVDLHGEAATWIHTHPGRRARSSSRQPAATWRSRRAARPRRTPAPAAGWRPVSPARSTRHSGTTSSGATRVSWAPASTAAPTP
jgi:hypothetical protein